MTWRILWIPVGCVLDAADWELPATPPAVVARSTPRPMRSHAYQRALLRRILTKSRCPLPHARSGTGVAAQNSSIRTRRDTWLVHAPPAWSNPNSQGELPELRNLPVSDSAFVRDWSCVVNTRCSARGRPQCRSTQLLSPQQSVAGRRVRSLRDDLGTTRATRTLESTSHRGKLPSGDGHRRSARRRSAAGRAGPLGRRASRTGVRVSGGRLRRGATAPHRTRARRRGHGQRDRDGGPGSLVSGAGRAPAAAGAHLPRLRIGPPGHGPECGGRGWGAGAGTGARRARSD